MNASQPPAALMSGDDYRESLRRYKPTVFVDGRRVESVADEPTLRPGINAIALTYDYALRAEYQPLMTAVQHTSGKRVNRLSHINTGSGDLLNKLEAVRLVCQETGCAQRYLTHDALNAIAQVSARIDDATRQPRAHGALPRIPAPRAGPGPDARRRHDRRQGRPQPPAARAGQCRQLPARRRAQRGARGVRGIVISGTKAIVTGAPYVHELLVMPCRNMGREDADFAVCCAVPLDAPGLTIVARPAGRPGEKLEHGDALFSRKYGQSTGVCMFDRVFVPWERVFYAGEWEHQRPPHLQLRDPPPPHLHRRARRLRRPADRRRRADVRGQRLRPGPGDAPARADGRAHHDHRELLRLRRGGQRLCARPTRTARSSCPTRCSATSASCCWRPRSTTCTASRTTSAAA